jgi:hypothetical protein
LQAFAMKADVEEVAEGEETDHTTAEDDMS